MSAPPALTTHVLDTARGRPGGGMRVDLARVEPDGGAHHLKSTTTDAGGRALMLAKGEMAAGTYLMTFHVADYFHSAGVETATPPYLDVVPVRFTIADPRTHYHVPLLVAPWSYTTYRGA
jgi:5-hydroxyisourate hydrolase